MFSSISLWTTGTTAAVDGADAPDPDICGAAIRYRGDTVRETLYRNLLRVFFKVTT